MLYEIGKLRFDMYYGEDEDKQLSYAFEILDTQGKHGTVFNFEDCKRVEIERVLAQLYADGWQMIQLTEETILDDDGQTPAMWFREAYFHRPKLFENK